MDKRMIHNQYQETLAERSMIIEPDGEGENWSFRWYTDPISNGLAKWAQYSVHVSEGYIAFHGMVMPRDEEEVVAMDEAIEFVKDRFRRVGLNEEDTEGGS